MACYIGKILVHFEHPILLHMYSVSLEVDMRDPLTDQVAYILEQLQLAHPVGGGVPAAVTLLVCEVGGEVHRDHNPGN